MTDNELLSAIANMLNKNSKSLEYRMDSMEERFNHKIDTVEQRLNDKIDNVEKSLRHEILKINLNLEHNIEPRLRHIEECYISTYDRYKIEIERMDKMQLDIEVTQDVLREHGKALEALTA